MNLHDYRLRHFSNNWNKHYQMIARILEKSGQKQASKGLLMECMKTHSNEALVYQDTYFNNPYRQLEMLKFLRDTPKVESVESITIKNRRGQQIEIKTKSQIESILEDFFNSRNPYGYDREAYDLEIEELEKILPPFKTRKPEKEYLISYFKKRCKRLNKGIQKEYSQLNPSDICILIGKILFIRGLKVEISYGGFYNPFTLKGEQRKNFIKLIKYYLK